MFSRLFKPKWEHRDPRVRRKAIESGAVPAEVLSKAALQDSEPGVRLCAIERLLDLDVLEALAASETRAELREAADQRRRVLLAAPLQQEPPLRARVESLQRAPSAELCRFLVGAAQVPEVRMAALEWVQDTPLLCTVAAEDPVAAVRQTALERIDDPQGWDAVARRARNRDKQISRTALQRLDAFRRAEAERDAAGHLCQSMEQLAAASPSLQSRAELQRLTARWQRLETTLPAPVSERFQQAREHALRAVEAFEARHDQRRALLEQLGSLLGSLRDDQRQTAGLTQAEAGQLQSKRRRWEELGPHEDDRLSKQFGKLAAAIERESEHQVEDEARAGQLRALIEDARSALDAGKDVDERRIREFERRWRAAEPPRARRVADPLKQAFETTLQTLREQLARQLGERRQALAEAERFLTDLEQALKHGELEPALSLRDRIRHRLKVAGDIDRAGRARLQQRLHGFAPQLDHLRDWRHWGSAQSRQRLCSEMEALADSPLAATEIATRVRNARDAWKRIDRAEGPASTELWQCFDQACTRAYAPFQKQREQKLAQLEAHRVQKEDLCVELETLEKETDWKSVDWSTLDARVRQLRRRWRRVGPVTRKDAKSLDKRYRKAHEQLDAHLAREREREVRRRRALIAEVEALAGAADRRAAVQAVKDAQKRWKPAVQAEPELEQALWQSFRAACDALFQQIDSERESAQRERETNLAQKQTLCDQLESRLNAADPDVGAMVREFAETAAQWQAIGPVPRRAEQALAARYEELQRRFAARRRETADATAAALLDGIRARARLCEHLEARALAGDAGTDRDTALVEETRGAWQALEPLTSADEESLRQRFELAGRALTGDSEARKTLERALQKNLDRRLALCLEMEVEAGVDSPAAFAEERLRLQASRLEDALAHRRDGQGTAEDRLRALQIAWYRAGPAPADRAAELEARFERALEALLAQPDAVHG
jgi:exonuclease SbcC